MPYTMDLCATCTHSVGRFVVRSASQNIHRISLNGCMAMYRFNEVGLGLSLVFLGKCTIGGARVCVAEALRYYDI